MSLATGINITPRHKGFLDSHFKFNAIGVINKLLSLSLSLISKPTWWWWWSRSCDMVCFVCWSSMLFDWDFCFFAFFFVYFFWVSIGIFRRFHWEFTKVFMCVVWLIGFLLVFLGFYWFWKYIFLVMFSEGPSVRFWYPFLYFYRGLGVFELLLCWFFWYFGIICKRCSWRFFWLVRQREGRERPENERQRETKEERITNSVCIFRNKSYLLRTKFVGFKMFWM